MKLRLLLIGLGGIGLLVLSSGCSSVTRGAPVAGTQIQATMNTGTCQVLGRTQGESTRTSILCGLIQVIDGDKVALLGVNFFEDQYAFYQEHGKFLGLIDLHGVSVEDRAYYKALAATPDADTVAAKSFIRTDQRIPLLWKSESATFEGKALKFKGND